MTINAFIAKTRNDFDHLLLVIAGAIDRWCVGDAAVVSRQRSNLVDQWLTCMSANTLSSYRYDLSRWVKWLHSAKLTASPIAPAMISAFFRDTQSSVAEATSERCAAAIKSMLREIGLLSPERNAELSMIIRHFHRVRRVADPGRSAALPADLIERLERTIDHEDPRDVRDLALIALILDAMVRPAEVLGTRERSTWLVLPINVEALVRHRDGTGLLPLRALRDKLASPPAPAFLSRRVMRRIDAWLAISNIRSGPLFRSILGARVSPDDPPYPSSQVNRMLKRVSRLAGMTKPLTTRRLRASTANQMLAAGFHLEDVRRASRTAHLSSVSRLHAGDHQAGDATEVFRRFESIRRVWTSGGDDRRQMSLPGM